jgi:ABC-2 type transport system permease protein
MSAFSGTGTLIRFMLRRDRIRIPLWIAGIVGFVLAFAAAVPGIYPTVEDRQARADLWETPVANLMRGPGYGLDDYTFGVMIAAEIMLYVAIAAALMSIFLIVRHTRREEETGRLELIRSSVVGHYAQPTAAFTVVVAAHLVIAALIALLLPLVGEDMAFGGSLAFGVGVAVAGIVFAGVALVTSQVSEFGRSASSMAATVLAGAFLIRAVGDVQWGTLSWFSPIAWPQEMRPFVDERWLPVLLGVLLTGVLVTAAFALSSHRDVAAGIVRPKPGPANASRVLANPFGFAFQQLRGSLIGWSAGLIVLGATFGSTIGELSDWAAENPGLSELLEAFQGVTVLESFLGFLVMAMALITAGFAIPAALRARSEENEGHAESVLSTALARSWWLGSYLLVAMLGSAFVLLMGSAALGILTAIDQNDGGLFLQVMGAALAYIPAIWTLIGVASVLFGVVPRFLALVWVVFLYAMIVGLFGDLLNIPSWMYNLSPYEHVPELPGGEFTVLSVIVLTLVALGLIVAGMIGFGRRDLRSV